MGALCPLSKIPAICWAMWMIALPSIRGWSSSGCIGKESGIALRFLEPIIIFFGEQRAPWMMAASIAIVSLGHKGALRAWKMMSVLLSLEPALRATKTTNIAWFMVSVGYGRSES